MPAAWRWIFCSTVSSARRATLVLRLGLDGFGISFFLVRSEVTAKNPAQPEQANPELS